MSKFKVGQKVKLNPETKPYTWNGSRIHGISINKINKYQDLIITELDLSDAVINDTLRIDPYHLLPLEETIEQDKTISHEEAIELRKFIVSELGIEHADRFQEVYEWITGEK